MSKDLDNVGYRRPPRHTQFRPGESGNPGGRPRKLPSLRRELEAELAESMQIAEGGHKVTVSKQRGVVKALVSRALAGDMRAMAVIVALVRSLGEREAIDDEGDREVLERFVQDEIARRGARLSQEE